MAVLDVPGPSPMRAVHHKALRRELETLAATPPRRRWRLGRPGVVIGVSIGIAVAGGAAAAAYVSYQPVTHRTTAHCYSLPSLAGNNGTTVVAAGAPGSQAQVTDALATCTMLWRDGFLVQGAPEIVHVTQPTTVHPVPHLAVCTMPDGSAGVFPDGRTCAQLGLPTARYALNDTEGKG